MGDEGRKTYTDGLKAGLMGGPLHEPRPHDSLLYTMGYEAVTRPAPSLPPSPAGSGSGPTITLRGLFRVALFVLLGLGWLMLFGLAEQYNARSQPPRKAAPNAGNACAVGSRCYQALQYERQLERERRTRTPDSRATTKRRP